MTILLSTSGMPRATSNSGVPSCTITATSVDCPAHKEITGNEKADEREKMAVEEPDARGMEWPKYLDRAEA